jgi:HEAT repeat protein
MWQEAIEELGGITLPEAATALIEAANWPRRRDDCLVALARLGEIAVPSLARGLQTGQLDTRRAIVEALARIQSAQAIGVLETALNDRAPAVRHVAESGLRYIRHIDRTTSGTSGFEGDH